MADWLRQLGFGTGFNAGRSEPMIQVGVGNLNPVMRRHLGIGVADGRPRRDQSPAGIKY